MPNAYTPMNPALLQMLQSPQGEATQLLPIDSIHPFQFQRRRHFKSEVIDRLADSIRSIGVVQPLVVRAAQAPGGYELIAGEQRLRAAKQAGLFEVPVIIRELTDLEAREVHLAENLLREDLNPVDETEGILEFLSIQVNESAAGVVALLYQMRNCSTGHTKHNVVLPSQGEAIEQAFSRLGMKWSSFVSHRLPVLKLPDDILESLRAGRLEYTKAHAIAKVKDPLERQKLLVAAIEEGLTLSQIKEQADQHRPIPALGVPTVKAQLSDTFADLKKAKVWEDPKKAKQLLKLMQQLRSLIEDS